MEILKTKIAIIGSGLTSLSNPEIEILASRVKNCIELSKCIKSNKTVGNG